MITKKNDTNVDKYKRLCYIFDYNTKDTYHTICKNIRQALKTNDFALYNRLHDVMNDKDTVKTLETRVHKLSYIHHVSNTIKSIQNIDDLLEYALLQALNSLESESGSIFIWDSTKNELELKLSKGRSFEELKGIKKRLGEGIVGLVAKEGKPLLVKNINNDPRFKKCNTKNHSYKTDSFLCVPLFANNKLIGVINVTEKISRQPFNDEELEFLFILANHVAFAIDNIVLYQQVKDFNKDLREKVSKTTKELKKMVEESTILKTYKENIIDSLSTGVYVVDANERITLWNKGMESHYKIKCEEAIGKNISEILIPMGANILNESIKKVISQAKPIYLEKILHKSTKTDANKIINYNIFPMFNGENDKPIGVVVLHDDITEKVDLEKELKINERLALIGKLASGIAHELNNPLDGTRRFINLSLDLLNETENKTNDGLAHEYLLSAKNGVNRMIKIVRSLLEFSHQTTTIHKKYVDINTALEDSIKIVGYKHAMSNILINKEYNHALPNVIDYSLQTVFTNLIDNAIDAMKEGGTLNLYTRKSLENNNMAEVVISDTGIGINENDLEHIFDPFFTKKTCSEGSGLGLAICQEIIKRSNGNIKVESNLGKGTKFTITVPFKN